MCEAVATSIDLVKTGFGMCIALRDALKNYKDLQDQAGQLCNMYTNVQIDLQKIEASLDIRENYEGNTTTFNRDQDPEHDLFKTLVQSTREEISEANDAVNELKERLAEASGESRRTSSRKRWKRFFKLKAIVLDASGLTDISSSLGKVRTCVQNASRNCTDIRASRLILGRLDELVPRGTPETFQPYFDKPLLSYNEVLDFESCDEEGYPITAEGRLRRKVLELLDDDTVHGVSASGKQRGVAHGMGGVGKTTALRALCREESVKEAYCDGICYLEFGQDADEQKVINELARCVRVFGGGSVAQKMKEDSSLSNVLEDGAAWLRDRKVLLVCDDLWRNEKEFGYLPDLTKLLREAPRSRLLISTRDRNISNSVGMSVEFAPLGAKDGKARKILLADVPGVDSEAIISDEVTEDGIQRILETCAGLPLALAIAGRGLKKSVRDSTTLPNGVSQYCELLERDSECITVEELEHYPGLARVIESSLRQCQEWGMSAMTEVRYGHKLDMNYMFKGLCVLEKQMVIPKRVLKHVWNTDDRCTTAAMLMFADCNLTNRVLCGPSTQQEYGLRLHDLVLQRCQQMAGDEHSSCHNRIVDAYSEKLCDSSSEEGEQAAKSQAWWGAYDDGYIFAHLSRHLVLSERAVELSSLLCDIRWILRRIEVGGWGSLNMDFERLFGAHKHVGIGIRRVHEVLKNSLPYARERHDLLAFYIFAHFSNEERNEWPVSGLLQSISHHFPTPWLLPATRYIARRDPREKWNAAFTRSGAHPFNLAVDWTRGSVLIANHKDIVLWCTKEHRILRKILCKHTCIALSENTKVIVSGSHDKTIRRWDAISGAPIGGPLSGHEDKVTCVVISGDGRFIVSGSLDKTVRRWDAINGAPIGDPLRGHTDVVTCVAVSSDAKVIVSGSSDKTVRRWDAESGAPIGNPLRGHEKGVNFVALSADGTVIASGSWDNTVRRWNAKSGAPNGEPLRGHKRGVSCLAVSADGSVIASGSDDRTVRRWDAANGAPIGEPLRGHEDVVTCVAVSSDGREVVSGSLDQTVRGWLVEKDIPSGDRVVVLGHENLLSSVVASSYGRASSSGSSSNAIRRNTESETPIVELFRGHRRKVTCFAVSGDGRFIISSSFDSAIQRWHAESGAPAGKPIRAHKDGVNCVAVSGDGSFIVSGSRDKTIRRWDAESRAPIGAPLRGHKDTVSCVAISRDGTVIVSGSHDRTIRRWDAQTGARIGVPLRGHEARVNKVVMSADGRYIVSASFDKTVRRWDATSGAPIGDPLSGHEDKVTCIVISGDGRFIVSGSCDNTIRRWDAESGAPIGDPLCGHGETVSSVAVSEDGMSIVSGSWDRTVRGWDSESESRKGKQLSGGHGSSSARTSVSRQFRQSFIAHFPHFALRMSCFTVGLASPLVVIGSHTGEVFICRRRVE